MPDAETQQAPNQPSQERIWAAYEMLSQWVAEMEAKRQEEREAA